MPLPINERLKAIRKALKLSQRAFAKEIFTAQPVLARMENNLSLISDRTIELVCYRFNVNRAYFREGKNEPMFCEVPQDVKLNQLYKIFCQLNSPLQNYLTLMAKEILKVQNQGGTGKPKSRGRK